MTPTSNAVSLDDLLDNFSLEDGAPDDRSDDGTEGDFVPDDKPYNPDGEGADTDDADDAEDADKVSSQMSRPFSTVTSNISSAAIR